MPPDGKNLNPLMLREDAIFEALFAASIARSTSSNLADGEEGVGTTTGEATDTGTGWTSGPGTTGCSAPGQGMDATQVQIRPIVKNAAIGRVIVFIGQFLSVLNG
jgi:hypothetical protein